MPESMTFSTLTPFRRFIRLLAQYRLEIRYVILYAVVAGLINLSLPLGIQALIGIIAGGSLMASWGVLILFIIVGAMVAGMLRLAQLSLMESLQRRLFTDAALEFAVRIPRLNHEQLRKEYLPELANRFFDTLTLQKGVPKLLMDGSTAILQILFSLLLLSFYHTAFVAFALILLLCLTLLFFWTAPRGMQSSLKESKQKYKLVYWLEEVGRVSTTFKLAGENNLPIQRTDELTMEYLDARAKHWRVLVIQFASSVVFRVMVLAGFFILGSLLVMNNQLNLGQFVASEILVLFVIDSVEKLILLHETGYDVLTATEKIGQVSDLPVEREDGIRVEEFSNDQPLEVELRNLSYQYADGVAPVLNKINLRIKAGERVAIAGYNGSGKSTLMQVLSVQRRDFTGFLLFNGLPKQNLHLRSLRERIGDFSAQEDIFKGSVLENITLGQPHIPLSHTLQVIEQVGLSDFIRGLPLGVNTELMPAGLNLPRSVINKIKIARAIAKKPKMLVLEDPLGFMNLRDRLRIARLLSDPLHQWTVVASTEDPLFAAMCDRIIVLREGAIVAEGSFDYIRKTDHYERIFRVSQEKEDWSNDDSK